jgi:hypothetical protein
MKLKLLKLEYSTVLSSQIVLLFFFYRLQVLINYNWISDVTVY